MLKEGEIKRTPTNPAVGQVNMSENEWHFFSSDPCKCHRLQWGLFGCLNVFFFQLLKRYLVERVILKYVTHCKICMYLDFNEFVSIMERILKWNSVDDLIWKKTSYAHMQLQNQKKYVYTGKMCNTPYTICSYYYVVWVFHVLILINCFCLHGLEGDKCILFSPPYETVPFLKKFSDTIEMWLWDITVLTSTRLSDVELCY